MTSVLSLNIQPRYYLLQASWLPPCQILRL
uniref:Uncharacterized protein n=1 Tax=Rhizophora mucronata TaxID=61149 RepID=A0A2P2QJQ9_RHIMU